MRLIDANDFFERLCDRDCDIVPQYSEDGYSIERIEETLDETPTVDAVQVVRCKDCANTYWSDGEYYCTAYTLAERTAPDGFCCVGVQK